MTNRERNEEEEYEIIDVTNSGWLNEQLRQLRRASTTKQIAVGGMSGWIAGYTFSKIGRAAAAAIGGSLLLIQVAHHQGLIQINWGKVDRSVQKAKRTLARDADKMIPHLTGEVRDFVQDNMVLAGGFAGGFLLGIAM